MEHGPGLLSSSKLLRREPSTLSGRIGYGVRWPDGPRRVGGHPARSKAAGAGSTKSMSAGLRQCERGSQPRFPQSPPTPGDGASTRSL